MENLIGIAIELYHKYEVIKDLGNFGVVGSYYGEQDPFNLPLLIETFDFNQSEDAQEISGRIVDGAKKWSELVHPKVERLIDASILNNHRPFVVSTYNSGSRLSFLIENLGPFSISQTHQFFNNLVDLFTYAHNQEICHGNFTSDWIFCDNALLDHISVGHWSLSLSAENLQRLQLLTPFETRAYSPERLIALNDPTAEPGPTPQADIFSIAIILFEMIMGTHPFLDFKDDAIFKPSSVDEILASRQDLKLKDSLREFGVEDEVSDVILKGLNPNPRERWRNVGEFFEAFSLACGLTELSPPLLEEPEEPLEPTRSKQKVEPVEPAKVELGKERKAETPTPAEPFPEMISPSGATAIAITDPGNFPSPKGRALAIAIILLIVSNVGWFLYLNMYQPTSTDTQNLSTTELIRVETNPSGAAMTEILPSGEPHEIGTTPLTLNLKEYARRQIRATFSKETFQDTSIAISSDGKQTTMVRVDLNKAK